MPLVGRSADSGVMQRAEVVVRLLKPIGRHGGGQKIESV
ncbi:hypothetical protein R615_03705 [Thalassolituus oleivorans R6-15]|nr:hypothetical protein R615_03705 [Thalassolituus oleivorans R6-15]